MCIGGINWGQNCPFDGLLPPLRSYLLTFPAVSKRVSSAGDQGFQLMSLWGMLPIQVIRIGERKLFFQDTRFYERTGNMQGNSPGMVSTPTATGMHWVNTSDIKEPVVKNERVLHTLHAFCSVISRLILRYLRVI